MSISNINQTEIDVILTGGRKEIDRYLVTGVHQLNIAVEEIPDLIAEAVAEHHSACRRQSRKQLAAIAGTVGAIASLVTPYVLRLF